MEINRESLKAEKKDGVVKVRYDGETIFQCMDEKNIDYDRLLSVIRETENRYAGSLDQKTKKILIILGQDVKEGNYKQEYLLDKLILDDPECMESLKKLDPKIEERFRIMAAVHDINYAQYNPRRLFKKWALFLALSFALFIFEAPFYIFILLLTLFVLSEPKLAVRWLRLYGMLKQNS